MALDHNIRLLIYRLHVLLNFDFNRIYDTLVGESVFGIEPLKLSRSYLAQLCRKLNDPEFAQWYLLGPYSSNAGRNHCMNEDEKAFILHIILSQKTFHLRRLRQIFQTAYRGVENINDLPSLSTIYRVLKEAKISFKRTSRRHIRFSESEALAFFRSICHIPPETLVFIDESSCCPDDFLMKYGWAPTGDECLIDQIVIGNRSFSLIIAVSQLGIVSWNLVEGTISEIEFQHFLNSLRARIFPESVLILDNASIHRTENTQLLLEEISHGRFYYASKYSPQFMPHERVLALIKNEVRERENQALLFPVETITQVVSLFTIGGVRSRTLKNFWSQYVVNHNHFLAI